jgi:integrase
VRAAAGLDALRFHDLRHTAVSLLLALGVPPHVVREIAGHSDIKVTMTVYAHGRLDEKAAALAQLGSRGPCRHRRPSTRTRRTTKIGP